MTDGSIDAQHQTQSPPSFVDANLRNSYVNGSEFAAAKTALEQVVDDHHKTLPYLRVPLIVFVPRIVQFGLAPTLDLLQPWTCSNLGLAQTLY